MPADAQAHNGRQAGGRAGLLLLTPWILLLLLLLPCVRREVGRRLGGHGVGGHSLQLEPFVVGALVGTVLLVQCEVVDEVREVIRCARVWGYGGMNRRDGRIRCNYSTRCKGHEQHRRPNQVCKDCSACRGHDKSPPASACIE